MYVRYINQNTVQCQIPYSENLSAHEAVSCISNQLSPQIHSVGTRVYSASSIPFVFVFVFFNEHKTLYCLVLKNRNNF